ncbi:MAG: acyltransferase [Oscillospiraceae bacterium]|nr:acyltransferase [Oscillospiraceae bacterium]
MLVHSHQPFSLPDWSTAVQRFGQMGCQIFFVLSAFGLCMSYQKSPLPWTAFMKKRIGKLAIGYWTMIVLRMIDRVLQALVHGENLISAANFPGVICNALFLHGLIPIGNINNKVVGGGWYVGTTVLLYALFPLLYKLYMHENAKWRAKRLVLFPVITLVSCAVLMLASSVVHPFFECKNNGFMYYSFVNQLPCFSLGFCLYDLVENGKTEQVKAPILWSAVFACAAVTLFFGAWKHVFILVPTLFGAAFLFLFLYVLRSSAAQKRVENCRLVRSFGQISYAVYLTHPVVVYSLMNTVCNIIGDYITNDTLWYYLTLPISFALVYFLAKAFHGYIAWVSKGLSGKRSA